MATEYLSKCYVAEESDAKLVIKGKRLGGLVGFAVLIIWGFPMVALSWWGYGRGKLPLAVFLLAEGIGMLAVLGALALLWFRVISLKHRIIFDKIKKEVHLKIPLIKGSRNIPYDAVKSVDVDLLEKEDWNRSSRSSMILFQLNLKTHNGEVYEIDRSSDFGQMTELLFKIRGCLGLPGASPTRPTRPVTKTDEEPTHEGFGLSQWIEMLADPDPSTRADAAIALGEMGSRAKKALPALSKLLQDQDLNVRRKALSNLGFIGPDVQQLPLLMEFLVSEGQDKVLRNLATIAIGRIGHPAKEAVPLLTRALDSNDLSFCLTAAGALVQIYSGQAKRVLPILIRELENEDDKIRGRSINAIKVIGSQAVEAVPGLIKALECDTRGNRILAASALGSIGTVAKAAVPLLKNLLEDPDAILRNSAKRALEKIERSTG
jgi:HEAT repeat protein